MSATLVDYSQLIFSNLYSTHTHRVCKTLYVSKVYRYNFEAQLTHKLNIYCQCWEFNP